MRLVMIQLKRLVSLVDICVPSFNCPVYYLMEGSSAMIHLCLNVVPKEVCVAKTGWLVMIHSNREQRPFVMIQIHLLVERVDLCVGSINCFVRPTKGMSVMIRVKRVVWLMDIFAQFPCWPAMTCSILASLKLSAMTQKLIHVTMGLLLLYEIKATSLKSRTMNKTHYFNNIKQIFY